MPCASLVLAVLKFEPRKDGPLTFKIYNAAMHALAHCYLLVV